MNRVPDPPPAATAKEKYCYRNETTVPPRTLTRGGKNRSTIEDFADRDLVIEAAPEIKLANAEVGGICRVPAKLAESR